MRFSGSYREHLSSAEAVQISTEGVEQLEIYFGKYVPQFFYSMLAPLTLFVIVGMMNWTVAVVLLIWCTADTGIHYCCAEICKENAGKILGNIHRAW